MANASFDAQFLNIPIRTLYINGGMFPVVVREATIKRGQGAHDTVEMSVLVQGELTFDGKLRVPVDTADASSGTVDIASESLEGQPVSFVFGVSPWVDTFYGYVLSVTPDQKFKQGLNYVISMSGATLICQQVFRRFYTNQTDTELVQRVADRAQLGFTSNSSSTYRWPSVGITKQTDWELATALAARAGCLLFNWGGVLRMEDPSILFKSYPFTTLVSSDDLLESERKLLDFKPSARTANQVATRPMEFFFFDRGGQIVSSQQSSKSKGAKALPYSSSPVINREEAELFGKSMENNTGRWLHNATARIRGDASIYPGVTVEINTGTKQATARFNGRWLVMAVSHSMKRDAFNTELILTRPGDSIPALTKPSFDPFWRASDKARPTLYLRDTKWFSSWANPYVEVLT